MAIKPSAKHSIVVFTLYRCTEFKRVLWTILLFFLFVLLVQPASSWSLFPKKASSIQWYDRLFRVYSRGLFDNMHTCSGKHSFLRHSHGWTGLDKICSSKNPLCIHIFSFSPKSGFSQKIFISAEMSQFNFNAYYAMQRSGQFEGSS